MVGEAVNGMDIYGFFRSSASYRVRIALNIKCISAREHYINLRASEGNAEAYLALNPSGLVPTLVDRGQAIGQSMAIIEYLEETHPNPPLLPQDPADRAYVRSIAQLIACDIHPLNNLRVLKHLESRLGLNEDRRGDWYAHWITEGFRALERLLSQDARVGTCCFGDRPGLADVFLVPQVFNAERMNCSLDDYPTIRRIGDRLRSLPEFIAAEPARQPDALPN